jgi:two-component system response regulator AtoC
LLESQLFGHLKGAFTGADRASEGLFSATDSGTLFLDEIDDIPLELQPKLLRAIDNHEILPIGSAKPIKVDTRIIASANRNLQEEVEQGKFREDLFYRLAVVTIHMPPLRDRREDIQALVDHFIHKFNKKLRHQIKGVTNEVLRRFLQYEWKGNVRELRNVIERAVILEDGELITPRSLPSNLIQQTNPAELTGPLKEAVRKYEREYVNTILRTTDGDKKLAAELLGVSVSSIYRRLQELEEEIAPHSTE